MLDLSLPINNTYSMDHVTDGAVSVEPSGSVIFVGNNETHPEAVIVSDGDHD